MSTKNLTPRANNEGGLGTSILNWLNGYIKNIYTSNITVTDSISIKDGESQYDVTGSAIINKQLGENGYVQYHSGMVVQWGKAVVASGATTDVTLPVGYTGDNTYSVSASVMANDNNFIGNAYMVDKNTIRLFSNATEDITVSWMTIGC